MVQSHSNRQVGNIKSVKRVSSQDCSRRDVMLGVYLCCGVRLCSCRGCSGGRQRSAPSSRAWWPVGSVNRVKWGPPSDSGPLTVAEQSTDQTPTALSATVSLPFSMDVSHWESYHNMPVTLTATMTALDLSLSLPCPHMTTTPIVFGNCALAPVLRMQPPLPSLLPYDPSPTSLFPSSLDYSPS